MSLLPPKREDGQRLDAPVPDFDTPHQNGIVDPRWPLHTPTGIADADYEPYRGRVDAQGHMLLVRADTGARDRHELVHLLRALTAFAHENERRRPSDSHIDPLEHLPETYRVTVTIGFGASLFQGADGHDRFEIAGLRPRCLKTMPSFPGDVPTLEPEASATDFVILLQSDSHYVNVAMARWLSNGFGNTLRRKHASLPPDVFVVRSMEAGFARPDKREFLRFDDGIDNLKPGEGEEMERLVFVDDTDDEPRWCRGGTYLVYRKIQEDLPRWEHGLREDFPGENLTRVQERMIGREKATGCPMSRRRTGPEDLTPVYPDATDPADGPLDAHVRKVQPRRPDPDLFGIVDLNRRFLRRPYPYFDGQDEPGKERMGLQFLAFMKSIQDQFEHVSNMWQFNEHFPVRDTGIDALYQHGILSTLDGGYYFCPPEPTHPDGFLGDGLFSE